MPMTVRLEYESKKSTAALGQVFDYTDAIVRLGHEAQTESPLELLQFVDPYGNTAFNKLQMPAVLRDLRRLLAKARTEQEKEALLGIEKLAMQSFNKLLYLWFYGD